MKITEFLFFRRMLIPVIVQFIFWFSSAICILVGIFGLFHHYAFTGLGLMIFGPLFIRVICEYIIVLFRMSDTLMEIRNALVAKKQATS